MKIAITSTAIAIILALAGSLPALAQQNSTITIIMTHVSRCGCLAS
jgi:hypothetical protein